MFGKAKPILIAFPLCNGRWADAYALGVLSRSCGSVRQVVMPHEALDGPEMLGELLRKGQRLLSSDTLARCGHFLNCDHFPPRLSRKSTRWKVPRLWGTPTVSEVAPHFPLQPPPLDDPGRPTERAPWPDPNRNARWPLCQLETE